MTLLVPNVGGGGGGGFSIGTNAGGGGDSTMNMSLDDMIASRRKESVRESRRGGRNRVSTADRSIATGRAKRAAAVNARRQLTTTKKPTQMEIEKEVKTQAARTQKAKVRQEQKKGGGRVAATGGRRQRAATKAAGVPAAKNRGRAKKASMHEVKTKTATVQVSQHSAAPTKKAVNAAVQAFRASGFQIPQGAQMVIRIEDKPAAAAGTPKGGGRNANTGGRSTNTGGRGRGRGGGNARTNNNNARNTNNNNNNRGRNNNNPNNNRRGGRGGRGGGRN